MNLIVTSPDGTQRIQRCNPGDTLLDALQAAGCTVFAPCGGNGTCGRCNVLVRTSSGTDYRLACQTPVEEGLEVIVEGGDMDVEAAADEGGRTVARSAAEASGENGEAPDAHLAPSQLGLAIDIGTTTVVFHLVDCATGRVAATKSGVNPQAAFGADVISRIHAAESPDAFDTLCTQLETAVRTARRDLAASAGVAPEAVERIALVGNTVMEHFAARLDPAGIGRAPFTPASLFGGDFPLNGRADGLSAYFAPAVAGYVGGDITAGLLYSAMLENDQLQLFVDVGTNGEMALGNRDGATCCATAAGPAFEGAGITFGMPALPGAISRVRIEGGALAIETIKDAPAVGLCGSGLIDAVACLLDAGIIDEGGFMEEPDDGPLANAGIVDERDGETVCWLDGDRRVCLTQSDVRAVQLAKAAVRAGIETLLDDRNVGVEDVDALVLAGGFGMHLDPHSACRIGLLPPSLEERITAVGNAAGKGAVMALSADGPAHLADIAARCDYLELSGHQAFNGFYVDAMAFEEEDD